MIGNFSILHSFHAKVSCIHEGIFHLFGFCSAALVARHFTKTQKMRGVRLLLVLRNLLLCIFFLSCLRSEYVSKLNVECQQNVVLRPSNWFFVHTTTMTILYQHSKHLMTNDKKSLIFIGQAPCVILTIGFVYKIPIMIQDKIHLDFQ